MNYMIAKQIQKQQNHGRAKYRGGADNLEEDDKNSFDDWMGWIKDHLSKAEDAAGESEDDVDLQARNHLIKAAGLIISCVECMDRCQNLYYPVVNSEEQMLDYLTSIVHAANKKWWMNPATGEQLDVDEQTPKKLLLIHAEISEGVEGHRKDLKDDKLPQYDMLDVELVDALIRILDLAGARNTSLGAIFAAKMQYNSVRKDHTFESRVSTGGKKY